MDKKTPSQIKADLEKESKALGIELQEISSEVRADILKKIDLDDAKEHDSSTFTADDKKAYIEDWNKTIAEEREAKNKAFEDSGYTTVKKMDVDLEENSFDKNNMIVDNDSTSTSGDDDLHSLLQNNVEASAHPVKDEDAIKPKHEPKMTATLPNVGKLVKSANDVIENAQKVIHKEDTPVVKKHKEKMVDELEETLAPPVEGAVIRVSDEIQDKLAYLKKMKVKNSRKVTKSFTLYHSGYSGTMRALSFGERMKYLSSTGSGHEQAYNTYKMLYDHITSTSIFEDKSVPDFASWLKITSLLDLESLYPCFFFQ